MKKAELLPGPGGLERGLQPGQLPAKHLFILPLLLLLIEPTPGAAEGQVPIEVAVVVEDVQGGKPLFGKKTGHLRRRVPPVVVVSLH